MIAPDPNLLVLQRAVEEAFVELAEFRDPEEPDIVATARRAKEEVSRLRKELEKKSK